MAAIPGGLFFGRSDEQRDVEIKELRADLNTRPIKFGGKSEEFQWVLRATLYTENKGITRLGEIGGSVPPVEGYELRGTFRGAKDVSIRIDSNVWSRWRCVGEDLVGMAATGSEIVGHSQTYTALSKWYPAPWNAEIYS